MFYGSIGNILVSCNISNYIGISLYLNMLANLNRLFTSNFVKYNPIYVTLCFYTNIYLI